MLRLAVFAGMIQDTNQLVEFCHWLGVTDLCAAGTKPLANLDAYLKKFEIAGLKVSHFLWGSITAGDLTQKPSGEIMDAIQRLGDAGIESLIIFIRATVQEDEGRRSEEHKRIADYYAALVKKAEQAGLKLGLHNNRPMGPRYPKSFFCDLEDITAFMEAIPSDYHTLCFCPGAYGLGGADPAEVIRKLGDRISGVHARDAMVVPPKFLRQADEVWLNGKGEATVNAFLAEGLVDWPRVFDAVRESPYDGPILMEHYPWILGQPSTIGAAANVGYIRGLLQARGM